MQQGSVVMVSHDEPTGNSAAMVVTAGGSSYRWARRGRLRLYVQQSSKLPGWSPHHLELVDEAIRAWMRCEGVRIDVVSWSVEADVRLYWTDRLPSSNPGVTMLYRNGAGRLTRADVFISAEPAPWHTGTPDRVLYATIAHELGHALGLPHDPSVDALMHASPLVTAVTPVDVAKLNALTHLP
jgi:hypothetical protein